MKTVVFLHIDRTGGMSLREALAKNFQVEQICPVPHHPQTLMQPTTYPVDLNADLNAQNKNYRHSKKHQLVMGHWDAGILDKIPGEKTILTVLRNPADRAASLWRYIAKEPMYKRLGKEARQLGMVDFLYKYRSLWADSMADQLAGSRWSGYPAVYEQAVKNLDLFDFVGVTEYLGHFTNILADGLGMSLTIEHINGTAPKHALHPMNLYEMVQKESAKDVHLYKLAKERCEDAIQQSYRS